MRTPNLTILSIAMATLATTKAQTSLETPQGKPSPTLLIDDSRPDSPSAFEEGFNFAESYRDRREIAQPFYERFYRRNKRDIFRRER